MATTDEAADFRSFSLGLRRRTQPMNYSYVNSKGFDDIEQVIKADEVSEPRASKTNGRKRKTNDEAEGPASKKPKTAKESTKKNDLKPASKSRATSKGAGTKKTPASKTKPPPVNKGRQAQMQRSKPDKAKQADASKIPKAPSRKGKTYDAPKKISIAAPRPSRTKTTRKATDEPAEQEASIQSQDPAEGQNGASQDQAEDLVMAAQARSNGRECKQSKSKQVTGQTCAPSDATRIHAAKTSKLPSPTPRRQFFSATAYGSGFTITSMATPYDDMSDTSSALSDIPEDLDVSTPVLSAHTLSLIAQKEADDAVPATTGKSSAANLPDNLSLPVSHGTPEAAASSQTASLPPSSLLASTSGRTRSLRTSKQVQRFGNLVNTAAAVAEDEVAVSSEAEIDQQESDGEEHPPPGSRKRPTKSAATTTKTPSQTSQLKAPRAGASKRKQSADANSTPARPAKYRKSSIVKLQVSQGLENFSATDNATTPLGPEAPTSAKNGLLTPTDSDEGPASPEGDPTLVDPGAMKVHDLAQKLMARQPVASKPLPQGQPLVWADSRQALCETVPYFKVPQSGCHANDGHVYSFLFDGTGHSREYVDPDVIISRSGGGMGVDKTRKLAQKQDHRMNSSQVRAVINDISLQNPLVIISGNGHEAAVCKIPHRYCVLGWYKPIAVWGEKTLGHGDKVYTTIKYRFERLDQTKKAWHAPEYNLVTDEDRETAGTLLRKTCSHCQKEYPQVYLLGWMCLNPACDEFWQHYGRDAPCGVLPFNPAFVLDRTPWPVEQEPYSVKPPVPDVGNFVGDNLTQINTRGICCPQCGRCSSRRLFKGWKCDNPKCTYQNFPNHMPVKVPMLHTPMDNFGDGPTLARNEHSEDVGIEVDYKHGFKVCKYTFAGVDGCLMHLKSNAKINRQKGGPDKMFRDIQDQNNPEMDLHLERRRFGVEKMGGNKAELKKTVGRPSKSAAKLPSTPSGSKTRDQSMVLDTSPLEPSQLDDSLLANEQPTRSTDPATEAFQDGDFMTAFAMNYGMPYKFVASGASMPFTDAPWPVRGVRADLNWASQTFFDPKTHVEFNELLIFAYLEGQKIEYHDDGEEGLGPRIATISLGGKAKMMLRVKGKHHFGCSKQGILTPERPIPGTYKCEERLAAWEEIQPLKDTNKALYEKRRREIAKELGLDKVRSKTPPDLVTITLNHGDIVLMEGYDIQKYLEHKVMPEQCLRFAFTCRVVQPEHLKESEKPQYEVEPDDESMSALRRMVAEEQQTKKQQTNEQQAKDSQGDED